MLACSIVVGLQLILTLATLILQLRAAAREVRK